MADSGEGGFYIAWDPYEEAWSLNAFDPEDTVENPIALSSSVNDLQDMIDSGEAQKLFEDMAGV